MVDVVAVLDEQMTQLFPMARPGKAVINESAKLAEHPVESGGTIVDHRVIQPVEIDLEVYVTKYAETYQKIRSAFYGNSLLKVQTRSGLYENMAIEAMPHEESPEMVDVFTMSIKLREINLVTAQFVALPPSRVAQSNDASTVDRGEQKPKSALASLDDSNTRFTSR
jgi:hypothetical protein